MQGTSKELQEVALKLGVLCQVRSQSHEKLSNTLYSFQFNSKSKNIRYCNKQVVSDYKGKVWCVTLRKNSVFLVRRKGIITFSGNCLGNNAYASNPSWYVGGDNKNGESELAGMRTDTHRGRDSHLFCGMLQYPRYGLIGHLARWRHSQS